MGKYSSRHSTVYQDTNIVCLMRRACHLDRTGPCTRDPQEDNNSDAIYKDERKR